MAKKISNFAYFFDTVNNEVTYERNSNRNKKS